MLHCRRQRLALRYLGPPRQLGMGLAVGSLERFSCRCRRGGGSGGGALRAALGHDAGVSPSRLLATLFRFFNNWKGQEALSSGTPLLLGPAAGQWLTDGEKSTPRLARSDDNE